MSAPERAAGGRKPLVGYLRAVRAACASVAALSASTAYAGPVHDRDGWTATIERTEAGATVSLHNATTAPAGVTEVIAIDAGGIAITLGVTHTPNAPGASDDAVDVLDITPGWLAIPASLTIPEQGNATIRVVPNVIG